MVIWIKIGTLPADRLSVVRKRKPPVLGEAFLVREREVSRPSLVQCDQIKNIGGELLYFAFRV